MSDFYTVLRRSIDRADAPDEEQRQEIYDRLRAVIVRRLDAHRPRLKDTEFRSRLVAFDGAVTRIEDEIAASFAAADDVFDELPYEDAPAALPEEAGAADYADEIDEPADAEPILDEETFLFDDETEPPEEHAVEEEAEPEAADYADETAGDAAEAEAYEAGEYDDGPDGSGADDAGDYEALPAEPEWAPPEPTPEIEAPEVAEAAGPSTMWGSAIDLAWDESTAQWHDPEEPVRPAPPPVRAPVAAPQEYQPRPDSEWDRRLQMALVEETVRSRGAAATPEWIAAETEPPDDAPFFEEGEWDADAAGYDDAEPLPERSGGRLGAVTARLRALSPGRLLRRGRAEKPAAPPEDPAEAPPAARGARVEPAFDEPAPGAPRPVPRRTSVRSIAIAERDEDFAEETARPLRAFRDDVPPAPPAATPSPRRGAPAPEPDDTPLAPPSPRAGAKGGVRPVRPTPAPPPSRADGRPQRTPPPARPARPLSPDADDGADGNEIARPAARRDAARLPAEPPAAPQRGVRPRLPPPPPPSDTPPGDQRSLAPAANRAVRYLGADLDDADEGPADRGDPPFAAAVGEPPQRRRLPPPESRNAPPEGRRVVPENRYGGRLFRYAVIGAIVVVLAVAAVLILPGVFGADDTDTGATGEQGIVLFGGTDPLVFQTGPDAPVNFDAETAGGIVRIVSSTTGTARATIGPGISDGVEGRSVRIQIDVRGTPGRPASELRLAYLRGNALLDWRTVTVSGDFTIVDAIWTIPTGIPSPTGDALLIAPGVPGDGTAVDIRRIVIDVAA